MLVLLQDEPLFAKDLGTAWPHWCRVTVRFAKLLGGARDRRQYVRIQLNEALIMI
jgi:hypothetical protein